MKATPYSDMPGSAFWRSGVAEADPQALDDIYRPKWRIDPAWRIGTAGSCFAQHISRHLRRAGYKVLDMEPPPRGLPAAARERFGYGTYSARYGNIYTVRQLLQLAREAAGLRSPGEVAWEKDGRHVDALRPAVEPEGFDTREQVLAHRAFHVARVGELFRRIDLLVFTLGLTEAWVDARDGTVFPTAPGTIAGRFDPAHHAFRNFGFLDVLQDFEALRKVMLRLRAGRPLRYLLTVSPVPLTATASQRHVLAATAYSKSVLRAVAGQLAESHEDIDYFPSYEIVTNPAARGAFFGANLRSVTPDGVGAVMRAFFAAHGEAGATEAGATARPEPAPDGNPAALATEDAEVQCEEALLEAFGR